MSSVCRSNVDSILKREGEEEENCVNELVMKSLTLLHSVSLIKFRELIMLFSGSSVKL